MSPARGTVSRSSGLEVGRRSCGKSGSGSAGPGISVMRMLARCVSGGESVAEIIEIG